MEGGTKEQKEGVCADGECYLYGKLL